MFGIFARNINVTINWLIAAALLYNQSDLVNTPTL